VLTRDKKTKSFSKQCKARYFTPVALSLFAIIKSELIAGCGHLADTADSSDVYCILAE